MIKDKKAGGPQELPEDPESLARQNADAEERIVREQFSSANPPPKAPAIKKSWSSPIQVMAKVEQVMRDLSDEERDLVSYFFHKQYCKARTP